MPQNQAYGRKDVSYAFSHAENGRLLWDNRYVKQYKLDNAMEKRYIVVKRRSEYGKLIRKQYKNDIGVPYGLTKGHTLMLDGYSNAITTFCQLDSQIMEIKTDNNMNNLIHYEHPTKEQLLEYFSRRIRVRKMTPREAMRLMDVDDADIDKIINATETVTLKNGTVKTKKAISKTAVYELAGNSIVVSVLYHIFRTMFIPNQPENQRPKFYQPSLFDDL